TLEERPSTPEHYGSAQRQVQPSDQACPERMLQRLARNHVRHGQKYGRYSQGHTEAEATPHVAQFGILFFCRSGYGSRFERHAALGACTGNGRDDLGVHGAGVFNLRRGLCKGKFRFQCHSAFGACAVTWLVDFRVHGAGVRSGSWLDGKQFWSGLLRMYYPGVLAGQVSLGITAEFFRTTSAAEVV